MHAPLHHNRLTAVGFAPLKQLGALNSCHQFRARLNEIFFLRCNAAVKVSQYEARRLQEVALRLRSAPPCLLTLRKRHRLGLLKDQSKLALRMFQLPKMQGAFLCRDLRRRQHLKAMRRLLNFQQIPNLLIS